MEMKKKDYLPAYLRIKKLQEGIEQCDLRYVDRNTGEVRKYRLLDELRDILEIMEAPE